MSEAATLSPTGPAKMLRAMVGIGMLCGLLIVLTYEGTLPRVTRLKAEALQQAIFKVVPDITSTVAYSYEHGEFVRTREGQVAQVYATYDATGAFKGVAIAARGQGYADIISILYGYDPARQQVVGFYVLESKETPGLGDKIEKEAHFLDNFRALDVALGADQQRLRQAVVTVKQGGKTEPWEIDGITGATISSRAIGDILSQSTEVWVPRVYEHQAFFKSQAP